MGICKYTVNLKKGFLTLPARLHRRAAGCLARQSPGMGDGDFRANRACCAKAGDICAKAGDIGNAIAMGGNDANSLILHDKR
jgi:ApbE superfamily uncharacterized protein (UPF0280 family)